jgi:hypothetical protein
MTVLVAVSRAAAVCARRAIRKSTIFSVPRASKIMQCPHDRTVFADDRAPGHRNRLLPHLPRRVAGPLRARQDHRAGERTTPSEGTSQRAAARPAHRGRQLPGWISSGDGLPAVSGLRALAKEPDSPDYHYGRGYDPRYQDKKKRKSSLATCSTQDGARPVDHAIQLWLTTSQAIEG